MRSKINVRYIDFTSARNGNRILHFSVCTEPQIETMASVEIPSEFLVGTDRIQFQDCTRISYAKLQHMVELGPSGVPRRLRLTASDIFEFGKPREGRARVAMTSAFRGAPPDVGRKRSAARLTGNEPGR